MQIHFLAGPPFGPGLYEGVIRRLKQNGLNANVLDPFAESGHPAKIIEQLECIIGSNDVLVAHGTALPLATEMSQIIPLSALFLSNGPITAIDPATRLYSKSSRWMRNMAMKPFWAIPTLRSSIGLRRLVVNPYVMDHDTIVRVCQPLKQSPKHRKHYAEFFGNLRSMTPITQPKSTQTYLIWGDSDLLYPTHQASSILSSWKDTFLIEIAGAKHLHPIESPWAMADIIRDQIYTTMT